MARMETETTQTPNIALSILIPTLDEAHTLGATLDAVQRVSGPVEVLSLIHI